MKKVLTLVFLSLMISVNAQDKKFVLKNEDGSIKETGFFTLDGKKDSIWVRYNDAGIIIGTAHFSNGTKDGLWETYNDKGVKLFELVYVDGIKKVGKRWDENGILIETREF